MHEQWLHVIMMLSVASRLETKILPSETRARRLSYPHDTQLRQRKYILWRIPFQNLLNNDNRRVHVMMKAVSVMSEAWMSEGGGEMGGA